MGNKIKDGLRAAIAGDIVSVTVAGVGYTRLDALGQALSDQLARVAELEAEIAALAAPCQIDGCRFARPGNR